MKHYWYFSFNFENPCREISNGSPVRPAIGVVSSDDHFFPAYEALKKADEKIKGKWHADVFISYSVEISKEEFEKFIAHNI